MGKKEEKSAWDKFADAMNLAKNDEWKQLYGDHKVARDVTRAKGFDKTGMKKDEALEAIADYMGHYEEALVKGAKATSPKFAEYRQKIKKFEAMELVKKIAGKDGNVADVFKKIHTKGLDDILGAYHKSMEQEDEGKFLTYQADTHIGDDRKSNEYFTKELIKRSSDHDEEDYHTIIGNVKQEVVKYLADKMYDGVSID